MTAASIQEILVGLASGDANSAWNQFLSDYSPLILHLARRYENDDGRVMDCYVFVCEKLSDDGFGRLLMFKPDEPAKFRAWLTAVVGNLCIDWRRKEYGRPRPLRAIARLPELDRLVFHNLYEAGMTRLDCLNALSGQFTDLTEERIAEINSRIHLLLSSRQRWQLLARKRTTISLSETASKGHTSAQPTEPGPQIDLIAQTKQDLERLEKAMSQLSPDERLILRLRYQHDLTLEEVARHMNLTDPNQARRQIEAAIAKLAKYMES